ATVTDGEGNVSTTSYSTPVEVTEANTESLSVAVSSSGVRREKFEITLTVIPTNADPADPVGATTAYQWQVQTTTLSFDDQGDPLPPVVGSMDIAGATSATITPHALSQRATLPISATVTDGEGNVSTTSYSTP